ncbi:hypothetical protein [Gymnodinialimonas sp.]
MRVSPFIAATAALLSLSAAAQAQSIEDLLQRELTFTLDQLGDPVRVNFVEQAMGTSNGIEYIANSTNGDGIFTGYTNMDNDQGFDDLGQDYDAIHTGSNITLLFSEPVQMLLVATANDNETGDGFDFGIVPYQTVDIEMDGTLMLSEDPSGTLALLIADEPMTEWVSAIDHDLRDGIDLAFFAFPTVASN